MASLVENWKKHLEQMGIDKNQIIKGTFVFSSIAALYISSIWGFCYVLSPTKYLVNTLKWNYLTKAYDNGMHKAKELRFLQKMPEQYRGRLTISFGEMLALKVLLAPVGLPLKVWLTVKVMQATDRW
ncbi:hypothetical protein SteCoe_5061 [Stentor coeruleus]|uniref:DUF1279 domain-containing protein n=1 Tax=Stentor coeruleus TaxID=5963 RepID=A0A1R2CT45_9CILI|nr:hypothetical protein SteCoe_5061 [Stentor coeruleus]